MQNSTAISPKFLEYLREQLPHGEISLMAERCGVSQSYVSRILLGVRPADSPKARRVLEAVRERVLEKHRAALRLLRQEIRYTSTAGRAETADRAGQHPTPEEQRSPSSSPFAA